jgi:hypothetical protein
MQRRHFLQAVGLSLAPRLRAYSFIWAPPVAAVRAFTLADVQRCVAQLEMENARTARRLPIPAALLRALEHLSPVA